MNEHVSPEKRSLPPRNNSRLWLAALPVVLLAGWWKFHHVSPTKTESVSVTETSGDASATDEKAAPIDVQVTRVVLRPMETVVTAEGNLAAGQGASAHIAVNAAGRIQRVLVREGDRVQAGQLIALVDNRAAAAAERSASAALSASLSDVRQAEIATRAAQSEQNNALRQAQLALQSAVTERNGAVTQAENALRSAQSDYRKALSSAQTTDVSNAVQQAQLGLRAAKLDRESSTRSARNALKTAQTALAKLRNGARPQEIRQAQAAVAQAQATRDRAATEVARVQFLFDKGIKARRELDDALTALSVAAAALQTARDGLSLVQAGNRSEDIRAGELEVVAARDAVGAAQESGAAKVAQAQSALELARSNLAQARQQRPEDVRAAILKVAAARDALAQERQSGEARVQSARAALAAASQGQLQIAAKNEDARGKAALGQSKIADLSAAQAATSATQLRAPISGVVTRRNVNDGEMADPATPILEISDTNALNLSASLSAANGANVRVGMTARVTVEGRATAIPAQVVGVGQIDPQTNLLSVRIAVPNRNGSLKVGAFATAKIVTRSKPLAVVVPQATLLSRDGKDIVMVAGDDGLAHQKTVRIGTARDGLVEIVSGVKPNQNLVRDAYQLDDGAPIRVLDGAKTKSATP